MVVFGKGSFIRAKWLYSGKVLYSGNVVVIVQNGCIRVKGVVFGQKCLYSGKVVVFGRKWLYSSKVVVYVQSGCNQAKWLYSGKVVLFGQKW